LRFPAFRTRSAAAARQKLHHHGHVFVRTAADEVCCAGVHLMVRGCHAKRAGKGLNFIARKGVGLFLSLSLTERWFLASSVSYSLL
jgi:hypothetical protein